MKRNKGYTLVELIVAVAVLILVMAEKTAARSAQTVHLKRISRSKPLICWRVS